jgi:L-alanine-DL-glutamate epimerase-like enolase superfamily enzyme
MKTLTKNISLTYSPLNLTLRHPFGISYGTSATTHNILVKLTFDGYEGLGEASPASYHAESLETVSAVLGKIQAQAKAVLGSDPFAIQEVSLRMDKLIAGNNAAKAAIEMAMHDLLGKIVGQPTYKLLGLSQYQTPMTDYTIGIDTLEIIEKKTHEAISEGYKMLKVKLGTAYDRDIIKTVRKVAPSIPIRVDANGGWNPKQAVAMSNFLNEQGVEFIEQPLPKQASVDDFALVKRGSPIPIFADESVCRANDVARLAKVIDGVVVKLAKTGGIYEAQRVIAAARAHDLQVMFGMMIESSIGVTASCQLQALCDYLDLDGALLLKDDPYQGAQYQDGYLVLDQNLAGLGVVPRA